MIAPSIDEALRRHGINAPCEPGPHSTNCPQYRAHRKTAAHRSAKVLGITIDDEGAAWGCNHCGWTGGEKISRTSRTNSHANGFAALHDYVDENGKVLAQKVRNHAGRDPKCWWRRPDGNGGWIKGKGKARGSPYRLPELLEDLANGHPIFVVEGEKDVDNLRALGVPATCNPDGAAEPGQKSKWRPEFSEVLRDADIIVIPDHDE